MVLLCEPYCHRAGSFPSSVLQSRRYYMPQPRESLLPPVLASTATSSFGRVALCAWPRALRQSDEAAHDIDKFALKGMADDDDAKDPHDRAAHAHQGRYGQRTVISPIEPKEDGCGRSSTN